MTKRQTHFNLKLAFMVPIALAFALSGCKTENPASRKVMLLADGGISANTGASAVGIASEQVSGYQRFLESNSDGLDVIYADETMADKDLQRSLRDEVQNTDKPLMALIGGTSNAAAAHGAALVNFFNVPLIIPSANGDNLFPVGNLWAFRLSPPASSYANSLFSGYVTKTEVQAIRDTLADALNPAPVFNIAIIYEQNTFGEAAAVAAVKAASAQELRVGMYQHFDPAKADLPSLRATAQAAMDADTQLVLLISSDPMISMDLVRVFKDVYAKGVPPVLVGQGGAFVSTEFMNSDAASDVIVMRQVLDRTNCPSAISSEYEAQSYAAMSLLQYAFQLTEEKTITVSGFLAILNRDQTTIGERRESLRDAIKSADIALPCLGKAAFDNNGQNSLARVELVKKDGGNWVTVDQPGILDAIKHVMFERMFQ